jgi:cell division initiation protein
MPYTPVELRHVRVGRALLGYKREAVQNLLEEIADSFETVWRERHELADHVETIEQQLGELRSREQALTQTLVAAEQAATHVKEQAAREAELIVAEAHSEARAVTRNAQVLRERLHAETRRTEGLLRAALGMLEEAGPERSAGWPNQEETGDNERLATQEERLEEPQPAQRQLRKVSGGDWVEEG